MTLVSHQWTCDAGLCGRTVTKTAVLGGDEAYAPAPPDGWKRLNTSPPRIYCTRHKITVDNEEIR